MTTETDISFAELGLSASILTALNDLGYEKTISNPATMYSIVNGWQ